MPDEQQPNIRRLTSRRVVGRSVAGRNPLERGVDVAERRLHRLVVVVALLLLPAVFLPGVLIWQTRDESPRPVVTVVTAITETGAKPVTPITATIGADDSNKVLAHWTWRGDTRTGVIAVAPGTNAGTSIPLNVDPMGNPTPAVPIPADAGVTAVMVVVVLLGVLMAVIIAAMTWVRRRYDRKRDALWDDAILRFFS